MTGVTLLSQQLLNTKGTYLANFYRSRELLFLSVTDFSRHDYADNRAPTLIYHLFRGSP